MMLIIIGNVIHFDTTNNNKHHSSLPAIQLPFFNVIYLFFNIYIFSNMNF